MAAKEKEIKFVGPGELPEHRWTRRLSEPDPDPLVHTFSRPPILEALSLLPVAARVGRWFPQRLTTPHGSPSAFLWCRYIWEERKMKREPIFDLNGVMLEPPKPGPYAGCPLGGIGGGCIGRGKVYNVFPRFRTNFRLPWGFPSLVPACREVQPRDCSLESVLCSSEIFRGNFFQGTLSFLSLLAM
jgi:hypothetical protein